jgi:hypothetical protein
VLLLLTAGAAFAHHTPQHARREALSMVKRLGGTVTKAKVDLHQSAVTDGDLELLASLDELQELDLRETAVTDKGIMHLHDLKNLRMLRIGKSRVTKAGTSRLQKILPKLEID